MNEDYYGPEDVEFEAEELIHKFPQNMPDPKVTVQVEIKKRYYNLRVSRTAANDLAHLRQNRYKSNDNEKCYLDYCKRLMNSVRKQKKEAKEQQLLFPGMERGGKF